MKHLSLRMTLFNITQNMKTPSIRMLGWLAIFAFSVTACKKPQVEPENDSIELPPKTQEGKHTFGCLLDGEVFVAGYENVNPLGSIPLIVKYNESSTYLAIQGKRRSENDAIERVSIKIYAPEGVGTYNMFFTTDEYVGYGGVGDVIGCGFYHDLDNKGNVTITHLDTIKNTVSGTFAMELINPDCSEKQTLSITDGRFDVRY